MGDTPHSQCTYDEGEPVHQLILSTAITVPVPEAL